MRILITGNLGYIGPVVVKHLRSSEPASFLAGLDTGYFSSCVNGWDLLPERFLSVQYYADIRRVPDHVFDGIEAVVHLAGVSNDPIGDRFQEATFAINHKATVSLALQAKRMGVGSFVFASSCSMYGTAEDEARTERSPLMPLTAYSRSKAYAERDLQSLAEETFRVTCLRFSTACGLSDRLRLDLVLNDFVAAAVTSRKIVILSDGKPWRPLINVKDMARAVEWALRRPTEEGGPFLAVNVGRSDWNYQVKELADAVAATMPGVEVSINKEAQPDKRSYRVNFDLFQRLAPLHQPCCDLESTILELKEGLERVRFGETAFRDSQFIRLRALGRLCDNGLLDRQLRWVDQSASREDATSG
jgi:nucleoside-diphosphate-sugar epimerase